MNTTLKRMLSAVSATLLLVPSIAGCSFSDGVKSQGNAKLKAPTAAATEKTQAPTEISIIMNYSGRVLKEDNPVIAEIEKRTNTKLSFELVSGTEFNNRYGVLVASSSIPDISKLNGFDYQKYASQGVYKDVAEIVDKVGPNLKNSFSKESWDMVKYKGKQYAIPVENAKGKYVPAARKDWLDALGLDVPETIDEYANMLRRFTTGDPDGNGIDDTYGMTGQAGWSSDLGVDFNVIFGAFGMMPNQYYVKNNQVISSMIMPEYRDALEFIHELWNDKVIDPDIFTLTLDQAQLRIAQGRAGSFTGWWATVPEGLYGQLKMKEMDPGVDFMPLPDIKGRDGKYGLNSLGTISGTLCIAEKSKNAEAAVRLIDYVTSDEGYELAYWGIKGLHYIEPGERTAEGQKAFEEQWLDLLSQLSMRYDLYVRWRSASRDPKIIEANRFMNAGTSYKLYENIMYGIPSTDEKNALEPDLKKYQLEMLVKFVTGQVPISKWDEYVSTWKSRGGQRILESMTAEYNRINGTNYTAAE